MTLRGKHKKSFIERSRFVRAHPTIGQPNGFDNRPRSLSNEDANMSLQAGSGKSKKPVTLPKMPWDTETEA